METGCLGAGIRFELVKSLEASEALEAKWRELLDSSARPELMLGPDWMLGWWKYYAQGRRLAIGLFNDGERLVGLAPFCMRKFHYRPGIPFRRLEFLSSSGAEQDGACGEYLNVIARAGYEDVVAAAVAKELARDAFGAWDECVLEMVDLASPMTAPLIAALDRKGQTVSVAPASTAFYLPLVQDWDTYMTSLPSKRRKWFKRSWRTFLDWVGDRGYSSRVAVDDASLNEGIRILVELHTTRWESDGQDGAFASHRFRTFIESYARCLMQTGKLDLRWLEVGGVPVAAQCSFIDRGTVYFYQSGRRMDVPHSVPVGIVILMLAMQDAMAKGLATFDFLGGDYPYKGYFTKHTKPLVHVRVARRTLREGLRASLVATVRAARAVRRPHSPNGQVPGPAVIAGEDD